MHGETTLMLHLKFVEKIKTYIMFSITYLNRVFYETRYKNNVEPNRPQMTIWRMRIACWIPKATNTHPDYVIFNKFTQNTG